MNIDKLENDFLEHLASPKGYKRMCFTFTFIITFVLASFTLLLTEYVARCEAIAASAHLF